MVWTVGCCDYSTFYSVFKHRAESFMLHCWLLNCVRGGSRTLLVLGHKPNPLLVGVLPKTLKRSVLSTNVCLEAINQSISQFAKAKCLCFSSLITILLKLSFEMKSHACLCNHLLKKISFSIKLLNAAGLHPRCQSPQKVQKSEIVLVCIFIIANRSYLITKQAWNKSFMSAQIWQWAVESKAKR